MNYNDTKVVFTYIFEAFSSNQNVTEVSQGEICNVIVLAQSTRVNSIALKSRKPLYELFHCLQILQFIAITVESRIVIQRVKILWVSVVH